MSSPVLPSYGPTTSALARPLPHSAPSGLPCPEAMASNIVLGGSAMGSMVRPAADMHASSSCAVLSAQSSAGGQMQGSWQPFYPPINFANNVYMPSAGGQGTMMTQHFQAMPYNMPLFAAAAHNMTPQQMMQWQGLAAHGVAGYNPLLAGSNFGAAHQLSMAALAPYAVHPKQHVIGQPAYSRPGRPLRHEEKEEDEEEPENEGEDFTPGSRRRAYLHAQTGAGGRPVLGEHFDPRGRPVVYRDPGTNGPVSTTHHRRLTCAICQKNFSNQSNLKRHRLIHTGEKPYKCGRCDRGFNNSSNRRKHERCCNSNADTDALRVVTLVASSPCTSSNGSNTVPLAATEADTFLLAHNSALTLAHIKKGYAKLPTGQQQHQQEQPSPTAASGPADSSCDPCPASAAASALQTLTYPGTSASAQC